MVVINYGNHSLNITFFGDDFGTNVAVAVSVSAITAACARDSSVMTPRRLMVPLTDVFARREPAITSGQIRTNIEIRKMQNEALQPKSQQTLNQNP